MDIIPVVDLLHGRVVRARRGERAGYLPIDSPLCRSSDPLVVAPMLCRHCAARRLYVADLDALQGGAPQHAVLRALLLALSPDVELWVDAGHRTAADAQALRLRIAPEAPGRLVDVYASESLPDAAAAAEALAQPAAVLSLDRKDGTPLDPSNLWQTPALWPARIVVMTLERVGADAGPDLATLRQVQELAPAAWLVGAGGIRNEADLGAAAAAGADAWLVASALHDLKIAPITRTKPVSRGDPPSRAWSTITR